MNRWRHFQYLSILAGIELSYFLSGYIFWHDHNVLIFWWSSEYFFFPSFYYTGFWIIALMVAVALLFIERVRGFSLPTNENLIIGLLFIASFVNAVTLWPTPEINPDSIVWNYQARYLAENSIYSFIFGFGSTIRSGSGLPLPTLIFGLTYRLLGVHRFVIQTINSIFFGLIVVLAYFIGKELFTKKVGLYSGIILLSSPFMISQVPLTLVDIATTFFIMLSICQIIRATRKPGLLPTILAAVAVLLASLCKVTSLFFLFPFLLVLYTITLLRSQRRALVLKRILVFFTSFAVLATVAILPLYVRIANGSWSGPTNPFITIISHPAILNANPYFTILSAIPKSLILSVTIPVSILALLGLSFLFRKRERRDIANCLLLLTWIIAPTMYTLDSSALNSAARWTMPTYPAYAILAASFLTILKDKQFRRMVLVSILIFSITNAHLMYGYAWGESTSRNLMRATEALEPLIAQGMSVRVCYDYMAAWMSIYEPSLFHPKGNPIDLSPYSLFSCIDPKDKLPHYLVLVRARLGMDGYDFSTYPTMSSEELQFLITHYQKVMTFEGGSLEGPWVGTTVETFMLLASAHEG